jgi:hypothetical protein
LNPAQADPGIVATTKGFLARAEVVPRAEESTIAPDGLDAWREA